MSLWNNSAKPALKIERSLINWRVYIAYIIYASEVRPSQKLLAGVLFQYVDTSILQQKARKLETGLGFENKNV